MHTHTHCNCTVQWFHVICNNSLLYFWFQYELRLEATRNRKNNYTTVVINVRDVNDNPPVFDRQTYRTQITEEDDRNLPKRILQVSNKLKKKKNVAYFCAQLRCWKWIFKILLPTFVRNLIYCTKYVQAMPASTFYEIQLCNLINWPTC